MHGLQTYFNGKPCKRGHEGERYTISNKCVECSRERKRLYYNQNKEKILERNKKWAEKNPDAIRRAKRTWAKSHPDELRKIRQIYKEHHKERHKIWRDKNKEKVILWGKKWKQNNKDKCRETGLRNRQKNPDRYRAYVRNRRARIAGAQGSHTSQDIASIKQLQKDRCAYCRCWLNNKWHCDHIIAITKGGSNSRCNIQLLCASCNSKKHNKDPLKFARELGRLI